MARDYFSEEVGNTAVAQSPKDYFSEEVKANPQFANQQEAEAGQAKANEDLRVAQMNASPLGVASRTMNMISSPMENAFLGNLPNIISKKFTGKDYVDPESQMKFLTEPLGMFGGASGAAVAGVGNAMKAIPSIVEKGFGSLPFLQKAAAVGKSAVMGAASMATQLPNQDNLGDNAKQYIGGILGGAAAGPVFETGLKGAIGIKNAFKPAKDKLFDAYNYVFGVKGKIPQNLKTAKDDVVAKIKAIQDNTPNEMENPLTGETFTTPSNRYETAIAHTEAKKNIWKKVADLSKGATEADAKINLPLVVDDVVKETEKGFGKVASNSTEFKTLQAIKAEAELIKKQGQISPTDSEDFMKSLFEKIKAHRLSGDPTTYSMKDFYSNLQRNLGNETDNVISNTLEKHGYKDARREYAIAKSSEKEVLAAANKFLKDHGQYQGVAHPITNIWALNDILHGAVTGDVSGVVRGVTVKSAIKLLDFMKNPDNKVRMIFDLAKKLPSPKVSDYVKPVNAELIDTRVKGLPPPASNEPIMSKAQPIRSEMKSKYSDVHTKAQSIKEPIIVDAKPSQSEMDFVNSFDKSKSTPETRRELNRILNRYNIPNVDKNVKKTINPKTVIPSKGSKLDVKTYPWRGKYTDLARQLEDQGKKLEDIPLHPAKVTVNGPRIIPKKGTVISHAEAGRNPLDEQKVGLESDPEVLKRQKAMEADRRKSESMRKQFDTQDRQDARGFLKDLKGKLTTDHITKGGYLHGEFEPMRGDRSMFSPDGVGADVALPYLARKYPTMFPDKRVEDMYGEELVGAYVKAMHLLGKTPPPIKSTVIQSRSQMMRKIYGKSNK